MIFESLALLGSHPVHEKTVRQMNHEDGPNHQAANSESGDARQQAEKQPQAAKEFSADNQKCESSRHSHMRKGSHGAVKTKASKPAQHFLRAMPEKHHSQKYSQDGQSHVVASTHQSLHSFLLAGSVILRRLSCAFYDDDGPAIR